MPESLRGTIKRGETVIFADVELMITGTKIAGGHGEKGGSFRVPKGGHVDPGDGYQLYRSDGRWGEIAIYKWREAKSRAWFRLDGDWQRQ